MNYRYEDIRNFYFENEKGKRIDCQKVDGNLFLYNVTGLGYEKEVEYVRVGNTFVKNKEEIKQNVINGEIEFYNMTYDEYKTFTDFILQAESLKLIYIPKRTNRVEYYRDIDLVKIEQSGEDDYNVMLSPITIYCKSLWYTQNKIIYTVEEIEDELRWDFAWDAIFADYEHRNIIFENKGHTEAPFSLEMNGYIENPKISIRVNNIEKHKLELNITVDENEKLIYCTKDNELYLYKILEDKTIENLFNYLDLNNINFFKIPKGVCEIKLEAESDILNTKLTIFEEYITV